jgi:fatty-acyl-CoA synthase
MLGFMPYRELLARTNLLMIRHSLLLSGSCALIATPFLSALWLQSMQMKIGTPKFSQEPLALSRVGVKNRGRAICFRLIPCWKRLTIASRKAGVYTLIKRRVETMNDNRIPVTPSAYSYPLLVKQLLYTPLACAPQQEIVYRGERRFTYLTLRDRIGRLASGLASLGIKHGDTVAVMDWDSHRYLECYFAVPMMGAVLQTVNIRLSPEQILYTLNLAEAKIVLVHADFLPIVEAIRGKLTNMKQFVLIADGTEVAKGNIPFAIEYEALLAGSSTAFAFPDFNENTRATMFYTTGTTGDPKGVYFSHRQLVLHTIATMAALASAGAGQSFSRNDVYMPMTPMFHVHAWGLPYVATLMGVKQVYPGRYIPDLLVELRTKEKATFSHCVPTILHMLLNAPKAKDADFTGWKLVIGGSALPRGLAKDAMDRGIDIFTGYGMSETCPVLTVAQLKASMNARGPDEQLTIRCKSGMPIPLVDLRIVDEDMKDVAHDAKAVGEVVVRSPWLTQGYLKDPENSERLWAGGYLHTQDVGHIDAEGYLQITDRLKDVIKSGGEWILSLEIENLVSQHPAVSETAVIGMKDAKWGERPLVLVVQKAGSAVTEKAIKDHVRKFSQTGQISPYAILARVLMVEQIDKTSVGKVNKRLLREKFAGRVLRRR